MVEPFATLVLNSILSSRSALGHTTTRKAMTHAKNSLLFRDFFTPHPFGKGKKREVEAELPDYECLACTARHGHACTSKHFLWCSKNASSVATEAKSTPRRSMRRHSSRANPRSPPHISTRTNLISSNVRHASSSSRQRPGIPLPDLKERMALGQFHQLLTSSQDPFTLTVAWKAFTSVSESEAFGHIGVANLIVFCQKFASAIDASFSHDHEQQYYWGSRLLRILEDFSNRIPNGDPKLAVLHSCLLAQAHSIMGELDKAISTVELLQKSGLDEGGYILSLHRTILASILLHRDVSNALEHLARHWTFLHTYVPVKRRSKLSESVIANADSLRALAYDILETVPFADKAWTNLSVTYRTKQSFGVWFTEVLCIRRLPREALRLLDAMEGAGFKVLDRLIGRVVRALCVADNFLRAHLLYGRMVLAFPNSVFTLQAGLCLHAHQGNTVAAQELYQQIQDRFSISALEQAWLLHAYSVQGDVPKVVSLFHDFFSDSLSGASPGLMHYTPVIDAHARSRDFEGATKWLERMKAQGLQPDVYVFTDILKGFALNGEVDHVGAVLQQMRAAGVAPNVVTYTIIITLLAHRQDPVAAEHIYQRALNDEIQPDRRMVTSLMNAHVQAGSWKGVIRAFEFLRSTPSKRLRLSIEVYNTLIKAYVLIGAPFRVVANIMILLETVKIRPDGYTYSLLIQSACDSGRMDVANDMFQHLNQLSTDEHSNLNLNAYVLTIMMAGYLRLGKKDEAKRVYDEMRARNIQPTAITFQTILQAYGNEGTEQSFEIAEQFLNSLLSAENADRAWIIPSDGPSSALEHVYRPLMRAYAPLQRPADVERLLSDMLNKGSPTLGVLTTLLDSYRYNHNIPAIRQLWPQILQLGLKYSRVDALFDENEHAIDDPTTRRQPNILCVPLSIYIDAMSSAGYHHEIAQAWKTLSTHGFTFDSHNWNHLAVALVRAGEPERAFQVIETVILPYQRRGHESRFFEGVPQTPLSFNKAASSYVDLEYEPHSEALRRGRRPEAVALAEQQLPLLHEIRDFVHPLKILQEVSPTWNTWVTHKTTLKVLLSVISRLESGMTPEPIQTEQDPEFVVDNFTLSAENRARAREILNRIYSRYPNAVNVVLDFETTERAKLSSNYYR